MIWIIRIISDIIHIVHNTIISVAFVRKHKYASTHTSCAAAQHGIVRAGCVKARHVIAVTGCCRGQEYKSNQMHRMPPHCNTMISPISPTNLDRARTESNTDTSTRTRTHSTRPFSHIPTFLVCPSRSPRPCSRAYELCSSCRQSNKLAAHNGVV